MARETLNYAEFVQRKETSGEEAWRQEHFYARSGFCAFCKKNIKALWTDSWRAGVSADYLSGHIKIWRCSCGWWEVLESEGSRFFEEAAFDHTLSSAVLRTFGKSSLADPLHALRAEVLARNDLLYSIDPKKMENFVASVMECAHDCDVQVCGRSHDGGIDLILLNGESPTLIQVKKRNEGAKGEPVAQIRHLLGAALLKGGNSCVFVTTADHFSREARRAATEAVNRNIVRSFELIDRKRLFEMLQLTSNETPNHWMKVVKRWDRYRNIPHDLVRP